MIRYCAFVAGVAMMMSVRMVPRLPLIFLIMIHSELLQHFRNNQEIFMQFSHQLPFSTSCSILFLYEFFVSGVSSADWGVSYSPSQICALNNSSVIMNCNYTYPTGHQIMKVFWTKTLVHGEEPTDLSEDPEYSQRLQYLGDKQQNCAVRLSHVTQKDEHEYCFRFTTDKEGKRTGEPGVTLTVTGDFDQVSLFFCALC